ncbi:hypothetical protein [Pseudoduganella namucuonensis]|uniref:hypothetical protein n=1 Tax=Pseudoduganella namucuonensis TaxID=1035707 RepID=UPI003530ABF1
MRKLLGRCSLSAFRRMDLGAMPDRAREAELLDLYTDEVAAELDLCRRGARGEAAGNSYGESVAELAMALLFELRAQPAFWSGLVSAIAAEHGKLGAFWLSPSGDAMLRKKVNDMYAGLRDKVDADNYQVATGRACSPNKMYTYRMLDTAYREIERLFANWSHHAAQVAAILDRGADGVPIEARQMKSIGGCKAPWVIRWSETLERFSGSPGPLHTRSKRFSSLRNNPDRIAALMAEIGDYEALSANMGAEDWRGDEDEAGAWLEDYWRVVGESEAADEEPATPDMVDQILQPLPPDEEDDDEDSEEPLLAYVEEAGGEDPDSSEDGEGGDQAGAMTARGPAYAAPGMAGPPAAAVASNAGSLAVAAAPKAELRAAGNAADEALAAGLSLPPRFMELASAAQDAGSWLVRMLKDDSLPIRLAVYHKLLGAEDESYPDAWLDPETGELPTLAQLAALDRISMPTLRKRRNEAIARLQAASARVTN